MITIVLSTRSRRNPMPIIYDYAHTVAEKEIDDQGHVNNLAYLRWMQEAAIAHSSAQGWPPERYHELGAGWVVRSHWIEYLQSALLNDEIVVRTWVSDFRKIRSLRKYHIIRPADDAVLARAKTDWTFVGFPTGAPRRIPPDLADSFQLLPTDEEPNGAATRK